MRDDDQLCVKVGPTAAGRWEGLKIRRGSSNVGYKICPPVEVGLTDLPKSGGTPRDDRLDLCKELKLVIITSLKEGKINNNKFSARDLAKLHIYA